MFGCFLHNADTDDLDDTAAAPDFAAAQSDEQAQPTSNAQAAPHRGLRQLNDLPLDDLCRTDPSPSTAAPPGKLCFRAAPATT